MTLVLYPDEHTGKEGVRTRLEAFVDLISKKREKEQGVAW